MISLRVIFLTDSRVNIIQWLVGLVFQIDRLIRKRDRYNHACKVEQVNHRCVAIVAKLIMSDCSCGSDRSNNGVELSAQLLFKLSPFREVFALVLPFLQLNIPDIVYVDFLYVRVEKIFNIWDDGFSASINVPKNILETVVSPMLLTRNI